MYYYGVKLHILGQKRLNTIPTMTSVIVTPAAVNDITTAKQFLRQWHNIDVFTDKIYSDDKWRAELAQHNVTVSTPIKLKKGQSILDSADKLFSYAVSRTRQAIESFFNWLQEKTKIQCASKIRSTQGLLSFVFARIASVAFTFNP